MHTVYLYQGTQTHPKLHTPQVTNWVRGGVGHFSVCMTDPHWVTCYSPERGYDPCVIEKGRVNGRSQGGGAAKRWEWVQREWGMTTCQWQGERVSQHMRKSCRGKREDWWAHMIVESPKPKSMSTVFSKKNKTKPYYSCDLAINPDKNNAWTKLIADICES